MIPFFLPIAENAPTAPTTATAQFTGLEVILKSQYRRSPEPAPIRNGEIADNPLKAALPNIPLNDFIAFAKGFFFAKSERTISKAEGLIMLLIFATYYCSVLFF